MKGNGMISLDEWRVVRTQYAKMAEAENQERFDKGMGTLPIHVAINDMILRDVLGKMRELEALVTEPVGAKKKG